MSSDTSLRARERLFRRVLRIYPAWWRARHGEAMIGTLLDVSDRASAGARWVQIVSLLLGGLAARVDTVIPRESRSLAARASLLLGTGFCAAYFLFHSWAPWADTQMLFGSGYRSFGGLVNGGAAFCALWFLGLLAYLVGMSRTAKLIMLLMMLSLLVIGLYVRNAWIGPWFVNLWFVALLGLCVIIGDPMPPSGRWLPMLAAAVSSILVFVGGFAVAGGFSAAYQPDSFFWLWVFPPTLCAVVILLVGAASLGLLMGGRRTGALSTAIATMPWLAISMYLALQHRVDVVPLVSQVVLGIAICEFAAVAIWAVASSQRNRRSTYIPVGE